MNNRCNVLMKETLRAAELSDISDETVAKAQSWEEERRPAEKERQSRNKSRNERACVKESVEAKMDETPLRNRLPPHRKMLLITFSSRTINWAFHLEMSANFTCSSTLPL